MAYLAQQLKLLQSFRVVNQAIGRAIVITHYLVAGELRQDLLGDLFAVFHAPLVEAVDVPHHALHEYFVLVQRNKLAECIGRELVEHDGRSRAVAFKHFMRQ